MVNLEIHIDPALPRLDALIGTLAPENRQALNEEVAAAVYELVRAHLGAYASSHHKTAERLGATPTGHWEKAAETMQKSADAEGAEVTIEAAGIQRARRDLHIKPREKKELTIPLHALAYGKRAATLADLIATPLYALVRSVTVPHDPEMLPTGDAIAAARNLETAIKTQFPEFISTFPASDCKMHFRK